MSGRKVKARKLYQQIPHIVRGCYWWCRDTQWRLRVVRLHGTADPHF